MMSSVNFNKFCIFSLLVIISCLPASNRAQSSEYPQAQVCFNNVTQASIDSAPLINNGLENLWHQLNGKRCTHVIGGLILSNIGLFPNGSAPDLSVLNGILEVSDFIYIYNVSLPRVEFANLRLIRGQQTVTVYNTPGVALAAVENNYNSNNQDALSDKQILAFPNLTVIQNGNVFAENNNAMCYFPFAINWTEIFDTPSQFKLILGKNAQDKQQQCRSQEKLKCSPSCGLGFCFSEEDRDCQIGTKCKVRQGGQTNRCYQKPGAEERCDSLCAGGCYALKECFACAQKNNQSKCLPMCPKRFLYIEGRMVPDPNFRYSWGPFCVKQCPSGFVMDADACALQCSQPNHHVVNNTCQPCLAEICPKKCNITKIRETLKIQGTSLDANLLKALINCTTILGDIILDDSSFVNDASKNRVGIVAFSQLDSLRFVEEITGQLHIVTPGNVQFVSDLLFLKRLKFIRGILYTSSSRLTPLHIESSNLAYLGLRNLQPITSPHALVLRNLPRLCYLTNSYVQSVGQWQVDNVEDPQQCIQEGQICDANCQSGCWGPGAALCSDCKQLMADGVCVQACDTVPGFYFNPQVNKCEKCHPLCGATCSGPRLDQCMGRCKFAEENGTCTKECNRLSYLASDTNQCRPCHKSCASTGDIKPVCTGPSDMPGPGGCSKCLNIRLDTNGQFQNCIMGECPAGYFSDSAMAKGKEANFMVINGGHYWVCRPCPKLCPSCTRDSLERATCLTCVGVWYKNRCMETCPKDKLFVSIKPESKNCTECHPQCGAVTGSITGCNGTTASDCYRCKNVAIFLNEAQTKFYCNESCPDDKPESVKHEIKGFYYCVTKAEKAAIVRRQSIMIGSLSGAGAFLLLGIVIAIAVICCCQKKVVEEKILEQMKTALSDKDALDFKSLENDNLEPDMQRLIMLKVDDVKFEDKNHPLGNGTFGSVYKGLWNVTTEETVKHTQESRRVWLPVAIKVVDNSMLSGGSSHESKLMEFLNEIRLISSVQQKHCLRLFGFCQSGDLFYLLSIYRPLGAMDRYLQQNQTQLSSYTLLLWASQIADGMAYLQMRGIVHRDLAARNVLIADESTVQITDFGLAKMLAHREESEVLLRNERTSMRWLAIETLREARYSHATDVWSYGVTLWEIFSYGKKPYADVETLDIKDHVEKGGRLSQPEICTLDVYMVMVKCWMEDCQARPNFKELLKTFEAFTQNPGRYLFIQNDQFKTSLRENDGMEMCDRPLLSGNGDATDNGFSSSNPHSRMPYTDTMDTMDGLRVGGGGGELGGRLEDDAGYMVPSITSYSDEGGLLLGGDGDFTQGEPLLPKKHEANSVNNPSAHTTFRFPFGGRGNNDSNRTTSQVPLLSASDAPASRPAQQKFVAPSPRLRLASQDQLRYSEDPTTASKLPPAVPAAAPPPPLPTQPPFLGDNYIPAELGMAPRGLPAEDDGYLEAVTDSSSPPDSGEYSRVQAPSQPHTYANIGGNAPDDHRFFNPSSYLNPQRGAAGGADTDYLQASPSTPISPPRSSGAGPGDNYYVESQPLIPPVMTSSPSDSNYIYPQV